MVKAENPYYRESELPLEEDEIKQLKKGFVFIPIFGLVFTIFFIIFFAVVEDQVFRYFLMGFVVIAVGVFVSITYALIADLNGGTKQVIQGLVTHKEVLTSTSNSKKTGNKTTYYIYFGAKKLNVTIDLYTKFNRGDLVEIHQAKRSYNSVFKTEIIKSNVQMDQIEAMDTLRRTEAKKRWWVPFAIFLAAIPIFIFGAFFLIADCIDCDDITAASIAEWENVPEGDLKSEVPRFNEIVLLLNDTLTNAEEEQIASELLYSARNGDLSQLLQYLDSLVFEDKTTLQWIRYKFDEQERFKSQHSVTELWQGTLRAIFGIKFETKKSRLRSLDNFELQELDDKIIENENTTTGDLKLWLNHQDGEDRQLFAEKYLQKDTANLIPALNNYIKSTWGEKMSLPLRKKPTYNEGREKYGLPVSQ
jgi:hypothetical protein